MSSDLYSAQGVEPFLEYQSASPPVSPEHSTAGRDGYFPAAQHAETSVAWSRRKSVSSKSPSSEYPPRPIFSPSSEQPGSSPTSTSPPASPSAASAVSAGGGGGGVAGLLRRKSSRASASGAANVSGSVAGGPVPIARRPSASALARKTSQQSRLTASSPSVQPLALPLSPTAARTAVGPSSKVGQQAAVHPHPSSPPPLPALNTNLPPAGSPPAVRGPNATPATTDLLPLPPPLTTGTSHRLSPQLEQPTPPLTPDLPSHALFQPPQTVIANRPAPYAAVAGPPASPAALGRGASSRRTSETSSGRVDDSLTTTASSGSSTVSAFGEPTGGNKAKAPAAADLSNPWRSQTERPLDTVRRLSRLVDGRDLSYQANRHSSYGLAATLSSPTSGRSDDPYADSSSSSSITPSSTPLLPWGGLPSSMSMSGPYPTAAPMVGAYPLPNRTVVTPFALDASPWPVWQTTDGTGSSTEPSRAGRGGTVKRKGAASAGKQRRQSDVGPASKTGGNPAGGGLAALQVAPTYSRSPLSQASSPEPSPPFVPSSSSAPPSIAEGRPSTLGRTKSAKRRLSFWRKAKDGETSDEKADVVPPLPASPAGIRLGKGGGRDRVVSTPAQQQQTKKQQTVAVNDARSRRAASEPIADGSSPLPVALPTPAPIEPEQRPGSAASMARSAQAPAKAAMTTMPPSDAKASRSSSSNSGGGGGGGGFGGFLRRFATLGRSKSSAPAAEKAKSTGVNELGQKTAAVARVNDTPVQQPQPIPAGTPSQSPAVLPASPVSESSRAQAPAPTRLPSAGSVSARSASGRSLAPPSPGPPADSAMQATPTTGSPQRALPLAPALPIFDSLAPTTTAAVEQGLASPTSSPGRRLPQPPAAAAASPERSAAADVAAVDFSPRAERARRMSKKLSNGSLPSAAATPSSPPRRLPEQPASLTTSPRQLPLPPSPSPQPELHALDSADVTGARLSPYAEPAVGEIKPVFHRQTSLGDASPSTPVGGSTPVRGSSTPPPPSATETVRYDHGLSLSSAATAAAIDGADDEQMPALVGDQQDDNDTPSHSLASTASIATPSYWEAPPAPAVSTIGGGKPASAEAVVSEA